MKLLMTEAMMIEFLAGPLVGETTSFITKENNINDGGPPLGGQFIMALAPEIISDLNDWDKNAEPFIEKLSSYEMVSSSPEKKILKMFFIDFDFLSRDVLV